MAPERGVGTYEREEAADYAETGTERIAGSRNLQLGTQTIYRDDCVRRERQRFPGKHSGSSYAVRTERKLIQSVFFKIGVTMAVSYAKAL